ncbi:DNA-binding NarL/FixJ family response regulator [Catenulispora sp. GAS73]|uniref:response regulator n=1 Tax=Catenulispora sp. GAS73 TaxID=3156269 RepID=UPI0035159758
MTDALPDIKVLIADDQVLLRGSLSVLVDTAGDMTACGEAATGREAVDLAERHRPDVVLMDIRMPDTDGLQATRLITAAHPATRVLILTTFDIDAYVYEALRGGASGFLLKDTPPADLLTAIRVVAAGDALLSPGVTRRLIAEFARRPAPANRAATELDGLTLREREVLLLVARGLSNTELAAHLHLSPATAKTHVSHLLTKLGARDRAQLVIAAYESGLVTPAR